MAKIVLNAGHGGRVNGYSTAGKRTPNGEPEWEFNNKQLLACQKFLEQYEGVSILRTDDPTGKTDVSLSSRVSKANNWKADIYVSFHNNANTGRFGNWQGMETYIFPDSQKSAPFQKLVHPLLLAETKNSNRGMKTANFYETKNTNMACVLLESFFMDSIEDYKKLKSDSYLKNTGEAVAKALVIHFNLKKKVSVKPSVSSDKLYRVQVGAFSDPKNAERLSEELKKKGYSTIIV